MREQPSKQILAAFRNSGEPWIAVKCGVLRDLVQHFIDDPGAEVTKDIAIADVHYWINRGDLKTYTYMAKRWRWSQKRAYRLYVELGIYREAVARRELEEGSNEGVGREQEGSRRGVKHRENGANSIDEGVSGEQRGSEGGVKGESYVKEGEGEEKEEPSSKGGGKRAKPKQKKPKEEVKEGAPELGHLHLEEIPARIRNTPKYLAAWLEFVRWRQNVHRKRGKLIPVTREAAVRLLSKLKTAPNPVEMIDQSIENDWTGFFTVKSGTNGAAERERKPIDYAGGF